MHDSQCQYHCQHQHHGVTACTGITARFEVMSLVSLHHYNNNDADNDDDDNGSADGSNADYDANDKNEKNDDAADDDVNNDDAITDNNANDDANASSAHDDRDDNDGDDDNNPDDDDDADRTYTVSTGIKKITTTMPHTFNTNTNTTTSTQPTVVNCTKNSYVLLTMCSILLFHNLRVLDIGRMFQNTIENIFFPLQLENSAFVHHNLRFQRFLCTGLRFPTFNIT